MTSEDSEQLVRDADNLLAIIDSCYDYGDPTYEPGIIIREAYRQLGFSESYVEDLVINLDKRKQVRLHYNHGMSTHPAERFDYWRLQRGRKHKVVKALKKAERARLQDEKSE